MFLRPDALHRGVERLLPEFTTALEPLYQRSRAERHADFGVYLGQHVDEASAALMAVVDQRAASSGYRALTPLYQRLRGTIEGELKKTLPKLAERIGTIATK